MFVLFPEANIFWTLKTFCVLCIQMSRESMKTKLKQMKTKKILESQLMTKIINTVTLSSYFSNIFNALQFMLVFDPFVWNVRDFSSMLSNFYLVHMFSMQAMWSIVRPLVENERFPSGSLRMSTKASQALESSLLQKESHLPNILMCHLNRFVCLKNRQCHSISSQVFTPPQNIAHINFRCLLKKDFSKNFCSIDKTNISS